MLLYEPLFYLMAIPAVLITGISKGGFGGGLGMVAVPLLAMAISPIEAAAIMLPILCLMDLVTLKHFKGKASWLHLKILLPAAAIGIAFGTLGFHYLNSAQIKLLIGFIAVLFVLQRLINRKRASAVPHSKVKGYLWGTLAGFTSFGVHAGGPPLNIYLLPLKLEKSLFVGTTVIFFTAINFTKLVPYMWLGQFNQQTLLAALMISPLAPIGVIIGNKLHHKISDVWFYRSCYSLLMITGVKLIFDGVSGLT